MDFHEADQRYRELRELLTAGKLKPGEYEKGAAQLRVLAEDGVWWAIHPRTGKWLRWQDKTWQEDRPPHQPVEEVPCTDRHETVQLEEKPPVGVVLKGEEALRQLLEIRRICEENTPNGLRYLPVDLKPGGLLRGIAYKLAEDGSLDPRIAILYAAADSAEGKKLYVGGHWVIMPNEEGSEHAQEPPTEKQLFASLVREMIDNLEIEVEVREKIKQNLDLNQISLVDREELPAQENGWWQVNIPATGTAAREFQQSINQIAKGLSAESRTVPRRKLLEEILGACERGLEQIGEGADRPLQAGIHAAMAGALVELGSLESDDQRRLESLHLAEDHAELVEWFTREAPTDLPTVETLTWLKQIRQQAVSLVHGVQALALQRRLERTEQILAHVCESYLSKKKQAMRDLYAARALENGSRFVENPNEQHKVLAVALWQAQAAQQLALKIGDTALVGQCQDALTKIEAELNPLRGEYA